MAKQSGLGDRLFLGGYNLSGDIGSVGRIAGGPAALDVTAIDKSAFERLGGIRDGGIDWTAYFNPAAAQAHPVLSELPTSDVVVTYCRGTTLGNPAASLVGKQLNYDGTRGQDGSLTFTVQAVANGFGLEWGRQLTAGIRTDTTATNGTSVEDTTGPAFVGMPGASGDYLSAPDAASLDIVGDLDVRVRVALDDWTPAAQGTLVAKWTGTGNQRSWQFAVTAGGLLTFAWSTDGTATTSENSSVPTGFVDGTTHWVRATMDVDNGASDAEVKFWTSEDGVTWTQLGTTQTVGSTTSIYASTAVVELGSSNVGVTNVLVGKLLEVQVYNGISGTLVANPVAGVSGVTDAQGHTWTLHGNVYTSRHTAFGLQAYLQVFAFTGTSATVKLQGSRDDSSWSDITGGGFTAVTAAPASQRIATGPLLSIPRYLRVATTGTFSDLQFAVMVNRNETEPEF